MKPGGLLFFYVLMLLFPAAIFSQQPVREEAVLFSSGRFITGSNVSKQIFKKDQLLSAGFANRYFVLIQFKELPSQLAQENLKRSGVQLHSYLPGKAYLATIQDNFNFALAATFSISSINTIPGSFKIDPELLNYKSSGNKTDASRIAVNIYPSIDRKVAVSQLQAAGAVVTMSKYDQPGVIFIDANSSVVAAISALPFVSGIHLQSTVDKPLNYNNVGAHGISGLNAPGGKNLNGSGVAIGIGDNADISTHIDFSGRLINRSPGRAADHGTHVAGTAAGAGIIDVKNHGMAPRATLISRYFSDIITDAPTYVADNNMVLTNNSYYSGKNGCPGNGDYDVLSNYIDNQLGKYPQLLHVVAAGNDGASACTPFPLSYGTIKSGWQSAKNVLTVGAMNTENYSIAYFSSRGPLKDGRLKPEITAGGWGITSTFAYNNYGVNYGTSMSSPTVTGALSLLYQRYRQTHAGADPKSSLVKTIVCNTAEDLGNAGPDYTFGFGMLNARRAVEALDSNRYFINTISNGGKTAQAISVPANTRRLKVMLYWVDREAAANAALALVNDLDLSVTAPAGLLHQPLILNPSPANVNDIAAEGADHVNNIEQVVIENPVPGTYTINVAGFVVPFGPQEYIISYEVVKPSVTVEYPFGGEKLVPGETENIRWSAYGNETNSFTIEYSLNNGASWVVINNDVDAAIRKYPWTVPTSVGSQALVRVSRNGAALSDQSNFNFSILGSPVATTTNACEGAIQVSWSAITGATSYDLLQLVDDSMQVIANTSGTTYLVKGLNKNAVTWLGVAAKNATTTGRRSVSVSALPVSGPCTLASFNNDVKVDSILEPNTARQGFSNAGNAIKPVKISIRNLGPVAVNGPFNVSFRYANIAVTETVNTTIAAGSSYTYTFSGAYPVTASGFKYDFKSWITLPADGNHSNDTAYKTVKYINNDAIISMPVSEGFESMPASVYNMPEMAIAENKRLDFSASTGRGRARPFVNTGFAFSGTRALTLDQAPFSDSTNADSLTISYNLSNYASKQLRMDFYYKNHGQKDNPGNKVWVRGSEGNAWIPAYDLFANQSALGAWKHSIININEVLDRAVPRQAVTNTFQVKIGEEGNTSANDANPVIDIDDGYTFDNLVLDEAVNDIGLVKIISPDISGCSLGSANPVSIRIKNYNNVSFNNLAVSYQVNGGAVVTENIASIAPNQTLDYVFSRTANLSAYIDYNINVWVKSPADSYAANDSMLNFNVHNSPVISSYPYLQNFDTSNGNFFTKGVNTSWQWGTPAKSLINKAASGTRAWVTGLAGDYNDNEASYLYSPCFDISGLAQPVLSFSHILITELNYDHSWVEYSTDGAVWQKLGDAVTGVNWYDDASLTLWTGANTSWHVSSIDLPLSSTNMRFRFVLMSDDAVTNEGIGIDDIHVFDKASIYTGSPVTGISQTVNGNNWVDFTSGGNRILSLNSNGADLGAVTTQVHPYAGAVRSSNDQYYANRDIVVRTAKPATGNVGVRFYFTEDEAQNLVNAAGCATCLKPVDPYEVGVTKYSGNAGDENGQLEDDTTGFFQYILPANTVVVPYDNGYYAEFSVNSFSEFWLSAGNIKPASNGFCPGETILFTVPDEGTGYQWQENNGTGYVNLTNGPRYAGTNTARLQLINLPTSFTGYKYRCLRNGFAGEENAVRFTNTWNGSTSSNWFIANNWSCGVVPDQFTDVIIPNGIVVYPVINANTAIKSLNVHPGSIVTVSAAARLQINEK